MSALHANQRGDLALAVNPHDVVSGVGEFENLCLFFSSTAFCANSTRSCGFMSVHFLSRSVCHLNFLYRRRITRFGWSLLQAPGTIKAAIVRNRLDPPPINGLSSVHPRSPLSSRYMVVMAKVCELQPQKKWSLGPTLLQSAYDAPATALRGYLGFTHSRIDYGAFEP